MKSLVKRIFQRLCHHEWIVSKEEGVDFCDGAAEYTSMHSKVVCRKCGKVAYTTQVWVLMAGYITPLFHYIKKG